MFPCLFFSKSKDSAVHSLGLRPAGNTRNGELWEPITVLAKDESEVQTQIQQQLGNEDKQLPWCCAYRKPSRQREAYECLRVSGQTFSVFLQHTCIQKGGALNP